MAASLAYLVYCKKTSICGYYMCIKWIKDRALASEVLLEAGAAGHKALRGKVQCEGYE